MHDVNAILTFLFQIRVEIRLRRVLALALGGNGEKSLRFQNDENVVVFMKQRESGRKRARDRLLRDVDAFILADPPLRILFDLTVHANATALQHLTQRRLRRVGELPGENFEQCHHVK